MVNYGVFERAIGLNWYTVDPNLRALMDRLLDPADREWAEGHLVRIGALCGGPIAECAETIDKNPPRLERYDRWGKEVCRIVHHPATLAAKRDAWEAGISGPRLRREAERRGRPASGSPPRSSNRSLSRIRSRRARPVPRKTGSRA